MVNLPRTALGAAAHNEPIAELRRIREKQRELQRAEEEQVRKARIQGYSWQAIAGALEISKQAAHKKFGKQ